MPNEDNPTPLVRLNRLNPAPDFPLYAKLEWVNPFGSVKDRAAWEMLRDLEERGECITLESNQGKGTAEFAKSIGANAGLLSLSHCPPLRVLCGMRLPSAPNQA